MLKRVVALSGAALIVGGLSLPSVTGNAIASNVVAQTSDPSVASPSAAPNLVPQEPSIFPEPGTEESIPLELVPLAIRTIAQQAAQQYFTDAELESAQFDAEGPIPTFELSGTAGDDQAIEVDVYPDGTVEEIESVIDDGDVPAEVNDALEAYVADLEVSQIEQSVRPIKTGLTEVYYEFTGQVGDNEVDVEVSEDGSQIVIERGDV